MGEQRSTACGSRAPELRSREGPREDFGGDPLRLDDGLEGDALKLLNSHPDGVRPAPFKDVRLQVLGAFAAQRLERPAALVRVRLLDEDDRLILFFVSYFIRKSLDKFKLVALIGCAADYE